MQKVIVIGGGITGLLVSYYLGGSPTVIEMNSTPKNSLNSLWTVIPPLCGELREICDSSAREYQALGSELGTRTSWKEVIRVPPRGDKILSKKETKEIEPMLEVESEVLGKALHIHGEALLNRLGRNVLREKVVGLSVEKDEVIGLKTDRGSIKGDIYIFAIGSDEQGLFRDLVEIKSYKGHVVVSPPLGIRNVLILDDRLGVEGFDYALLNGDSYISNDPQVEMEQVEKTLQVFTKYLKRQIEPKEIRVGFRSVSKTGLPIADKIFENAVLVTGYRFGWALAPYLAKEAIKLAGIQ
ncbi:NAD(P)/FAD-dependent oxidoreductase [Metallosphaera hakonensis]|uniref:FAD-dependent oxidoreductase n=1 Tax=Metallosphaera hakonensis JCM 8857 = DSM 7519 TaxID=1293036 RepID=A0A2U9IS98_9CREN|nr:FAD-binding oxidoreductase [Metallosphaera hakonensis]AWR98920.1 FAD-dependent oxidoreductase [Metallosphaera hakonensis JCM 8857 = DSM 7519]